VLCSDLKDLQFRVAGSKERRLLVIRGASFHSTWNARALIKGGTVLLKLLFIIFLSCFCLAISMSRTVFLHTGHRHRCTRKNAISPAAETPLSKVAVSFLMFLRVSLQLGSIKLRKSPKAHGDLRGASGFRSHSFSVVNILIPKHVSWLAKSSVDAKDRLGMFLSC
jgi:hypothetical protein